MDPLLEVEDWREDYLLTIWENVRICALKDPKIALHINLARTDKCVNCWRKAHLQAAQTTKILQRAQKVLYHSIKLGILSGIYYDFIKP